MSSCWIEKTCAGKHDVDDDDDDDDDDNNDDDNNDCRSMKRTNSSSVPTCDSHRAPLSLYCLSCTAVNEKASDTNEDKGIHML